MLKPWIKYLGTEPIRTVTYLSSFILLKLVFQIVLFKRGFISVSADEFARGIRAARWASQPQLNILTDVKGTWLPFEKYLNGLLLLVWPDVILAPRVTVFIASCFVLIALFVLVYYLFDNFIIAALATTFVLFQPWYIWLSGTPMLEMYYLACFLGGLVFLVIWLREERRGYWFWAGFCFMSASGFHVQSWTFLNLVNLMTVPYLYGYARHKQWGRFWKLVGFYVLGNSLILVFALIEFFDTGELFAFLAKHTTYSRWYYGGYNVSVVEKLAYYPRLIAENSNDVVWLLLIVALVFLIWDKTNQWKLFPLVLAAAALVMNSVLNVFSGPPSAAPGRYSLWYGMMIAPYLGYGAYHLAIMGKKWGSGMVVYVPTVLAAGLFLTTVWWGAVRIPNFPRGMSQDAVETGYYLDERLNENAPDEAASFMVELQYWDYLAVQLTAGHYDAIVYDRESDLFNRNTPSIFSGNIENVCSSLMAQSIQYVALRDPNLKANAQLTGCLFPGQEIGAWTIYTFDDEP